jgi:hypothetical protein
LSGGGSGFICEFAETDTKSLLICSEGAASETQQCTREKPQVEEQPQRVSSRNSECLHRHLDDEWPEAAANAIHKAQ